MPCFDIRKNIFFAFHLFNLNYKVVIRVLIWTILIYYFIEIPIKLNVNLINKYFYSRKLPTMRLGITKISENDYWFHELKTEKIDFKVSFVFNH